MESYEQAVFHILRTVATERRSDLPPLEASQTLTYDLGLSSLDLARVVATLELELNADPFNCVPITSVRTVGDLCAAYRLHFHGDSARLASMPADDGPNGVNGKLRAVPDRSAEIRRQVRSS